MSQKSVITKIILDPNGSPFMQYAGSNMQEISSDQLSGVDVSDRKVEMFQDVMFPEHPHEWRLSKKEQPRLALPGIEGNCILFGVKDHSIIKLKLYPETSDPTVGSGEAIVEVELDGIELQKKMDAVNKAHVTTLSDVLNRAGGNHEHRLVRRFQDKLRESTFKAQLPYLKGAFDFVRPNQQFLLAIRDLVDGLTLQEAHDIDPYRKAHSTLTVSGLPKNLN